MLRPERVEGRGGSETAVAHGDVGGGSQGASTSLDKLGTKLKQV
jgi:hypothetical protein